MAINRIWPTSFGADKGLYKEPQLPIRTCIHQANCLQDQSLRDVHHEAADDVSESEQQFARGGQITGDITDPLLVSPPCVLQAKVSSAQLTLVRTGHDPQPSYAAESLASAAQSASERCLTNQHATSGTNPTSAWLYSTALTVYNAKIGHPDPRTHPLGPNNPLFLRLSWTTNSRLAYGSKAKYQAAQR